MAEQRFERSGQAGNCRNEQMGHYGRPVAPVETVEFAGDPIVESTGDCFAFRSKSAVRSQPQSRRRTTGSDSQKWRSGPGGGVSQLCKQGKKRSADGKIGRDKSGTCRQREF